jgi:hypothetical protein
MIRRVQITISAAAVLTVTVAIAPAEAYSDPFDGFRAMFAPPRHQRHVYHAHKPGPVKAAAAETTADTPPAPAPAPADADAVPDAILPIPAPRPAEPGTMAAMPPIPPERPAAAQPDAASAAPGQVAPASGKSPTQLASLNPPSDALEEKPSSAFANLAALGVKSVPHAPIEEGRCTVLDPVSISALESGSVPLIGETILNDRMAETLARWVHDDVVPAAHEILAGQLTGIRVIGSYSCRARYDLPAHGKMSEHGFANAIDVAAFRIDKRWIEVGGDKHNQADDARFLDSVRHAACRRFTTVLGPGEPLHDTHFHLDLARRGKTGRYTICE